MPPSGNFLPPSGIIMCGTGRQSHSKPTTINNLCLLPGTANRIISHWVRNGSINWNLTVLLADLLLKFRNLQREAQRSFITLPNLLTYRDRVLKALELIETIPYPDGREEQSGTYDVQDVGEEDDEQVQQEPSTKRRKLHNSLVTNWRSFSSIRHEVVASAKNFIQQRLNEEQSGQFQAIIDVTNANNETKLIASGRKLVEEIFGKESVQSFADDAVSYFVSQWARSFSPTDSDLSGHFSTQHVDRESSEVSHTAKNWSQK